MTTIAYDGKTLAADSRCTSDFIEQAPAQKIRDLGSVWAAGTGSVGAIQTWLAWYQAGCDVEKLPDLEDDLGGILIVSKKTGKVQVWGPKYPYPCVGWSYAVNAAGSGEQFAMGALLAGATAAEAVKIAAKLDGGTGGKIQVVQVRG